MMLAIIFIMLSMLSILNVTVTHCQVKQDDSYTNYMIHHNHNTPISGSVLPGATVDILLYSNYQYASSNRTAGTSFLVLYINTTSDNMLQPSVQANGITVATFTQQDDDGAVMYKTSVLYPYIDAISTACANATQCRTVVSIKNEDTMISHAYTLYYINGTNLGVPGRYGML